MKNVVVGTTVYDDDHLMFAEIRSPQTLANLRVSPAIEVNVVDPILRRGYRFRGTVTIHDGGEVYERGIALLAAEVIMVTPEQIRAVNRYSPLEDRRHIGLGRAPGHAALERHREQNHVDAVVHDAEHGEQGTREEKVTPVSRCLAGQ